MGKKNMLHSHPRYDDNGTGTMTILLALLTIGIIVFSILSHS